MIICFIYTVVGAGINIRDATCGDGAVDVPDDLTMCNDEKTFIRGKCLIMLRVECY